MFSFELVWHSYSVLVCLSRPIQSHPRVIVIKATVRGASTNVTIDTSSKSASARIEEAKIATDASKEQIGNVTTAKMDAAARVRAKMGKNLTLHPASLSMTNRLL